MGRKKGSLNKTKTEKDEKVLRRTIKSEPKESRPPRQEWKPEPEIKSEKTDICQCGHSKTFHYGGEKGHCNTADCGCLELQ